MGIHLYSSHLASEQGKGIGNILVDDPKLLGIIWSVCHRGNVLSDLRHEIIIG
jgi:hypothetical protein